MNGIDLKKKYPLVKAFLAGSISGTCSTILFQPLDLVKTRMQNPQTYINSRQNVSLSMINVMSSILQENQLKGLWKGMTPSLVRCIPGVGLYFCTLEFFKRKFFPKNKPNAIESVILGAASRTFSGTLLIPVTVIKTRFESGVYRYPNVSSALKEIYRKEGFRGMTCGILPTLFRDAPFSGLYLMFYTQTKQLVPYDLLNSPYSSPVHFTCGITAGIMASIVTQPADVIKTKMQLYPDKFRGVLSAVTYIHSKYGVQGYFIGMVPRMLRRTLMAAMAWTVYERLSRSLGLI